ncbi:sensor histidine kinase [Streptomyces lonarensis]|uniref:sensor histidine kinase n=2 Tax=Streptomyces lonarensis TaxID=700599 RepID=UPI0030C68ABB
MSVGRSYVLRGRAIVVVCCAAFALLATGPEQLPATATAAVAAVVWTVLHLRWWERGMAPRTVACADVAFLAALCLTQGATVPAAQEEHGHAWVLVAVSVAIVAYQFTHPPLVGAAAALLLAGADLLGVMLGRPDTWMAAVPQILWLLVQAAMGCALYQLVLRRCRAEDRALAAAAQARRRHKLSRERRRAEEEYLAVLHDTCSATLLMAAAPAGPPAAVLRAQATRDVGRLEALRAAGAPAPAPAADGEPDPPQGAAAPGTGGGPPPGGGDGVELATVLAAELPRHHGPITTSMAPGIDRVPAEVAAALRGAMAEALRNTARHAAASSVRVGCEREDGRVVLRVDDDGRGFDPAAVPRHRWGLSGSVVGRMARIGGAAAVSSRPGGPTSVVLTWPAPDPVGPEQPPAAAGATDGDATDRGATDGDATDHGATDHGATAAGDDAHRSAPAEETGPSAAQQEAAQQEPAARAAAARTGPAQDGAEAAARREAGTDG